MSQNKEFVEEIIEYIESSIHTDLEETDFIKYFRNKVEEYLKEKQA